MHINQPPRELGKRNKDDIPLPGANKDDIPLPRANKDDIPSPRANNDDIPLPGANKDDIPLPLSVSLWCRREEKQYVEGMEDEDMKKETQNLAYPPAFKLEVALFAKKHSQASRLAAQSKPNLRQRRKLMTRISKEVHTFAVK